MCTLRRDLPRQVSTQSILCPVTFISTIMNKKIIALILVVAALGILGRIGPVAGARGDADPAAKVGAHLGAEDAGVRAAQS